MRKFLSLFLAAILVLSSLCLPAVADGEPAAQNNEPAIGSVADDYAPAEDSTGVGTWETLKTALTTNLTQVKGADTPDDTTDDVYHKQGTYHLTADITVTVTAETTLPLLDVTFNGTFDGCGKTIKLVVADDATANVTANIPANSAVLFAKLGGTVQNLTF